MIVEKIWHNAWSIEALINNRLIYKEYYYYSKREAIRLFKAEFLRRK